MQQFVIEIGKSHAIWGHRVLPKPGSGEFPTFAPDEAGTQYSNSKGMQG